MQINAAVDVRRGPMHSYGTWLNQCLSHAAFWNAPSLMGTLPAGAGSGLIPAQAAQLQVVPVHGVCVVN